MMAFGKFLLAVLCMGLIGARLPAHHFAEGQVWEYRTRPGDEGSLLKIQKIEVLPEFVETGPIYHVSIIGLHFPGLPVEGKLQHAPFSKVSLDMSVIKLSKSKSEFPDVGAVIAEWKAGHGGVFTVTVAEAVNFAEQTMRSQMLGQ